MSGRPLNGSNYVTYTPVQAQAISTFAAGGISQGGAGDSAIITEGTRFLWEYYPDNPSVSGFTGTGRWGFDQLNTPLYGKENILEQFASGDKTNLNDEFTAWQQLIKETEGNNYVTQFILYVGKAECCVPA